MRLWTLFFLACNGGANSEADGPTPPRATLLSPEDGDQRYGTTLLAEYEVDDLVLDAAGIDADDVPGKGHVHVYLDGTLVGDTADTSWTFADMTSGRHDVEVRPATNDHQELGEHGVASVDTRDPHLTILDPVDGSSFSVSSALLTLNLADFTVDSTTAFGDTTFDQGRYQVRLDGTLVDYGFDPASFEVSGLTEGDHTVALELATADGTPIQPTVSDEVVVNVAPATPVLAVDRLPYLGAYPSATIPLDLTSVNAPLEYHVYVDAVFASHGTAARTVVQHVPAGQHRIEVRLVNGSSELPTHDHVNVYVPEGRPDVTITQPGDLWGVAPDFDVIFQPENFTLDAAAMGGANVAGHGHIVARVDGVEVAETASSTVKLTGLVSGDRLIELELTNNDGTALEPPVWTQITVSVQ